MHILTLINLWGSLLIALAFGLYAIRWMNSLQRIFFIQLLEYIFITILSYLAQLIPGMHKNNQWVYNLAIPIETGLLCWGAYEYFKSYKAKFLVWIGFIIFFIVFIVDLIAVSPLVLSTHGLVAEGIVLIVPYLLLIYRQFTTQNATWKHSPELWISLGIVLYFGGSLPYLSLFNYLQTYHPKVNLYLLSFIDIGLSNVRYLLLAVGFWLVRRNAIAKTAAANE